MATPTTTTNLAKLKARRERERNQQIKHLRAKLKQPGLSAEDARKIMGTIGGLAGAGSLKRSAAAREGGLARAAQRRETTP